MQKNNYMLHIGGHVLPDFFRRDVLFLQGEHSGFCHSLLLQVHEANFLNRSQILIIQIKHQNLPAQKIHFMCNIIIIIIIIKEHL